jgi:NADP-dependent 3-hydroxy acid dehydrogenase YdfG
LNPGAAERGGDIVNISSGAGRTARAGNGVYAATKWGINGWSESLCQELLPHIRVSVIEPGAVTEVISFVLRRPGHPRSAAAAARPAVEPPT